jgi:pyruvate dehydrogenase E2 component (dihydrolipoamide acetyltransferase)
MTTREFKLPDPGEGLLEAEIVEWKVAVGDAVKVNDIVVEVETAKSLVELPIPWAGTVTGIHVSVGDEVEVGTVIISIDDGADAPTSAESSAADEPEEEPVKTLVGYGPKASGTTRRARKSAPASAARPSPAASAEVAATATPSADASARHTQSSCPTMGFVHETRPRRCLRRSSACRGRPRPSGRARAARRRRAGSSHPRPAA